MAEKHKRPEGRTVGLHFTPICSVFSFLFSNGFESSDSRESTIRSKTGNNLPSVYHHVYTTSGKLSGKPAVRRWRRHFQDSFGVAPCHDGGPGKFTVVFDGVESLTLNTADAGSSQVGGV